MEKRLERRLASGIELYNIHFLCIVFSDLAQYILVDFEVAYRVIAGWPVCRYFYDLRRPTSALSKIQHQNFSLPKAVSGSERVFLFAQETLLKL